MSAIRVVFLYCDGGQECPRDDSSCVPFKIDPLPGEDAAMQRAVAKAQGWTKRGSQDYCSECSKRMAALLRPIGGQAK